MKEEIAKFTNWIKLKIKLHLGEDINFYFKEREIWWASIGANVGSEIEGKNTNFERPVLVLKKFSKDMMWVLPLTSKHKESRYHHKIEYRNQEFNVVLSQLRTISSKRLLRKIRKISPVEFGIIRNKTKSLL